MVLRLDEACGRCELRKRIIRDELSVPFLVLFIPLSFPTLGNLRRWRPRWRDEVSHLYGRWIRDDNVGNR